MKQLWKRLKFDTTIWSSNLIMLACAAFMNNFGTGLLDGARANFFIDTLGLSGNQVLWLEGIREIPGLALIFIAALTMRMPLSRRAGVSVLLTGIGYGLYATIHSYSALLVVAVIASLGMHMWMPLHNSLAMNLSTRDTTGRVMGALAAVGSLAGITGMGVLALVSRISAATPIPLGMYYIVGGSLIFLAGFLYFRLPITIGATEAEPPRMLLKRNYWLYYVLTFFEGSRKQVLHTFGTLVLVDKFGLEVWHISLLLLISGIVNMIGSPAMGRLIDRYGERAMLSSSYIVLVLCCLGFATIHTVWILILLLILIKLVVTLGMALSTYVYRTAPPEELTPTLSAGISINHITSVAMPLIAGMLLPIIGYEGIFLGTGGLILLSVPFTLVMRGKVNIVSQTQVVGAQ
ncbi:MAG: MFS transporter [Anaerolineae bacterium]|nr:MFS transporter [Anaerolineae bacterium]